MADGDDLPARWAWRLFGWAVLLAVTAVAGGFILRMWQASPS
ncbi:hypothetical protein ODZ83_08950 [Acaricomes phytoseiuli]|nr:hypothetical protein [Acaricomes phytoseiuli]MCW1250301.1 hypothetical protein [Acaricomes phytoseiuli]